MTNSAYSRLERRFRRLSQIDHAASMLQWDHATMMPAGGAPARAEALAELALMSHEILIAAETGADLDAAQEEVANLDDWQRANLHEMRQAYLHATAVPSDLVTRLSIAALNSETAWRELRAKNDFAGMRPHLEELLGLVRLTAQAKAEAMGLEPYDALLDSYEPGARASEIESLFAELKGFLPSLLDAAIEAQTRRGSTIQPKGPFPVDKQRKLQMRILDLMGFDRAHGRLDESHHPFSGGVPDDVRMTTRYDENNLIPAVMATIHETGHSLYERGLPANWRHQPVGRARGMAMHESQSLTMEMQAGRSDAVIGCLSRELVAIFGQDPAFEPANLGRLYRRVGRSLIRVDADEISYPLHVILRFELERAMIRGDLEIAALPEAWNDGMARYLGVIPPDHRQGCLQDVHWPSGAFGYFPTYTMGALAAAQLFAAAREQVPNCMDELARGNFGALLAWLRSRVHALGRSRSMNEMLLAATGRPLGTTVFRRHLEARYLA